MRDEQKKSLRRGFIKLGVGLFSTGLFIGLAIDVHAYMACLGWKVSVPCALLAIIAASVTVSGFMDVSTADL